MFTFHIIELPLLLLPTVFWLWMLVDCGLNTSLRASHKFLWLLLIFFTHILGAIAYFFIARPKKNAASQFSQGAPTQESQPQQPRAVYPEQAQQDTY